MSKKNQSEKVLVTGGAGFIGSHIVDRLIELGYPVCVIDDLSTGSRKNINKKAEFVKLDLGGASTAQLTQALAGAQYIFHLAAIPRNQFCNENPLVCHRSIVNGTLNLLNACVKNKGVKKIILASSCVVYGTPVSLPISESETIKPQTAYAVQKFMQESYVNLYARLYGLPSIILRYFGVYGTRRQSEGGSYPNVLAAFLRDKKKKNKIFITGNGEQSRDMIHVFDVVEASMAAMKSPFVSAEAFNIGTGRDLTINKIAKYFACPIEYIEPRPGDIKHFRADIKKATKLLKWKPQISFEEGIRGYLNNLS